MMSAPPLLTRPSVIPDSSKQLSDGVVVQASVLARLLGVKLLTVDATVLVSPAQLTEHEIQQDAGPVIAPRRNQRFTGWCWVLDPRARPRPPGHRTGWSAAGSASPRACSRTVLETCASSTVPDVATQRNHAWRLPRSFRHADRGLETMRAQQGLRPILRSHVEREVTMKSSTTKRTDRWGWWL